MGRGTKWWRSKMDGPYGAYIRPTNAREGRGGPARTNGESKCPPTPHIAFRKARGSGISQRNTQRTPPRPNNEWLILKITHSNGTGPLLSGLGNEG